MQQKSSRLKWPTSRERPRGSVATPIDKYILVPDQFMHAIGSNCTTKKIEKVKAQPASLRIQGKIPIHRCCGSRSHSTVDRPRYARCQAEVPGRNEDLAGRDVEVRIESAQRSLKRNSYRIMHVVIFVGCVEGTGPVPRHTWRCRRPLRKAKQLNGECRENRSGSHEKREGE